MSQLTFGFEFKAIAKDLLSIINSIEEELYCINNKQIYELKNNLENILEANRMLLLDAEEKLDV